MHFKFFTFESTWSYRNGISIMLKLISVPLTALTNKALVKASRKKKEKKKVKLY